jgi:hypothetical protein
MNGLHMNPVLLLAFGLALVGCLLGYLLSITRALMAVVALGLSAAVLALARGGEVAVALLMIAGFALPVLAIPTIVGVFAGQLFRTKKHLLGSLLLMPIPVLIGVSEFNSANERQESELAARFVEQDQRIQKLAHGPVHVRRTAPTKFSDSSRARYEFDFPGKSSHYIVIDVSRQGGRSDFRLSCVTTLSMGQRDGTGDPCAKGAIALPTP